MKPYLGITGFVTNYQVRDMLEVIPSTSERSLMVGVLASLKTLREEQNNFFKRYPKKPGIAKIFPNHDQGTFNVIHYNTKEPDSLKDQLLWLTDIGGSNLDGFQLNMCWPSVKELDNFRAVNQYIKIILQVGERALRQEGYNPAAVAERVASYRDLIEYVLIDPSGGTGKQLNIEESGEYLRALKDEGLGIGLGVAGGLSPSTVHLLEPLASEFPDLSWDAESGVRDKNDNLDIEIAKEYISKSLDLERSAKE